MKQSVLNVPFLFTEMDINVLNVTEMTAYLLFLQHKEVLGTKKTTVIIHTDPSAA